MAELQQQPPMKKMKITSEDMCINTVRILSAEQPTAGSSGHPGAPIGCAPMAHVLFGKVMQFNPKNPTFTNRDRFVLSNGHACALQYTMLHLTGYDLSLEDLKSFRRFGSKTPGHPESFVTPGVEVCTGPLGQGISNAVGMAIGEKHLASTFNQEGFPIVDHFTYVICGDGCLQEGVSSEASSLAGHLGLGKLIVLYDDNKITIDGSTDLSFTENVAKRYESYHWHVQTVEDGNYDVESILAAVEKAKQVTDKPSLIKISTIIGLGSVLQNTYKVHGAPLKPEDMENIKSFYHLDPTKSFDVPDHVRAFYDKTDSGVALESRWTTLFGQYAARFPDLAVEFQRRMGLSVNMTTQRRLVLPENWTTCLPMYTSEDKPMATRQYSEKCLNAIAAVLPELMGGSADLTPSNLTKLTMSGDFQHETPEGRYLRFGVREHAMAAICNGMFAHGGIRPFCATFYNFIGYALGSVRLSALSKFGVIYIATHDSIFLGEDGPTHQPIEMNASLRSMPNMYVFRPADGNEVSGSYAWAIEHASSPSVLALTRQGVPNLSLSSWKKVYQGGYIVQEPSATSAQVIIIASGSEVSLALEAAALLTDEIFVRVVSMPCLDLFAEQSKVYQHQVLGSGSIPIMSLEAASTFGWAKYAHVQFGLDRFGASGNISDLRKNFGFLAETVAAEVKNLVRFYDGRSAPLLFDVPPSRVLPLAAHHHD